MTNGERITYLESKIKELEDRFESFEKQTNADIHCLKSELQALKNELSAIKNNTDTIINVNEQQTTMLTKMFEKSFDSNLQSISFFQKFSKRQLLIIGSIIAALIVIIKFLLGIPL